MADEVVKDTAVSEGEPKPAPPALDQDALNRTIAEGIKTGLSDLAAQLPQPAPMRSHEPTAPPAKDPIAELVTPVIAPYLGVINARAESAIDAAKFYSTHEAVPEVGVLRDKYRDKIEKVYQDEMNAGRLTPRWAIWNFLKGGELSSEITEAVITARDREKQAALEATVAGPGARRPMGEPVSAGSMTQEQLDKAMEGVIF